MIPIIICQFKKKICVPGWLEKNERVVFLFSKIKIFVQNLG